MCEQRAPSRYLAVERLGIEPATSRSRIRHRNHYISKPQEPVSQLMTMEVFEGLTA